MLLANLQNIWIGGGVKSVSKFLTTFLEDNLDEIDQRLQLNISIDGMYRAYEKIFEKTANYAREMDKKLQISWNTITQGL